MFFFRASDVTNLLRKVMTDKENMLACIKKVINVVVKKLIMNRLVIIVTDCSAKVVYL
jgi:hypothetical protein